MIFGALLCATKNVAAVDKSCLVLWEGRASLEMLGAWFGLEFAVYTGAFGLHGELAAFSVLGRITCTFAIFTAPVRRGSVMEHIF